MAYAVAEPTCVLHLLHIPALVPGCPFHGNRARVHAFPSLSGKTSQALKRPLPRSGHSRVFVYRLDSSSLSENPLFVQNPLPCQWPFSDTNRSEAILVASVTFKMALRFRGEHDDCRNVLLEFLSSLFKFANVSFVPLFFFFFF